jgi:hypothetical protein
MNKFIGILVGLIFLLVPIYAWIVDFAGSKAAAITFLQGGIIWGLIFIGAVSLLVGLTSLKD